MDSAVLAQIERGEVEPKGLDRPDQPAERAARGQRTAAASPKRTRDHDKIGAEALRIRIGLAAEQARARCWLARQRLMSRRKPRVDTRQGAPIGLVSAARRGVAARLRQVL